MNKIIKVLLKTIIRFYQKVLSPLKPPVCRYYPTCSQYAYEAFDKYGLLKGSFLAIKRLLRCNPLFKGGFDPLP
jgi:putative membrane protein insertion efficiency factor